MGILTTTTSRMLILAGKKPNSYRGERARRQVAAAFGAAEPVLRGCTMVVDAVALCIVDDLAAQGLARRQAAHIVRTFFDRWIEAVSRIEHNNEAIVFTVCELDPAVCDGNDMRVGIGPADGVTEFKLSLLGLKRMVIVNVAQIMHDVEMRGRAASLDLTVGDFFLPPNHPLFVEWIADFRRWRTLAFAAGRDAIDKGPGIDHARHRAIMMQSLAVN